VRVADAEPVGVNFLVPFMEDDQLEVAAARARLVDFFWGEPDAALVARVHGAGALAAWQVGSAEEARAAAAAGCDLVVAQGVEAGGHVRGKVGLLPLLEAVLEAVDLPVVAAGGIATARAMAGALAAGADAVRVGTRLIATEEANAHPQYVAAVIAAAPEDTVVTTAFGVGWPDAPHRVLRSCVAAAEGFEGETVAEMALGDETMAVPRFAPPCPAPSTTGAVEAMALYAGQSVAGTREVRPAADVVREMAEGAERLLEAPLSRGTSAPAGTR
jgi:NAD(P)H-dependent flavin oxidoreductase YrpB (nitropropane dioxygenase family)